MCPLKNGGAVIPGSRGVTSGWSKPQMSVTVLPSSLYCLVQFTSKLKETGCWKNMGLSLGSAASSSLLSPAGSSCLSKPRCARVYRKLSVAALLSYED